MLIFKNFDKNKLPILLLPIAGAFLILFVFMGDGEDIKIDENIEDSPVTSYETINSDNRTPREDSRLELYREKRSKQSDNSHIVTDDDFYDLEEDTTYNYDNLDTQEREPITDNREESYASATEPKQDGTQQKKVVKYVYIKEISTNSPLPNNTQKKEINNTQEEPIERTRSRNSLVVENASKSSTNTQYTGTSVSAYISNDNNLVKTGSDVNILLAESMKIDQYRIPKNTILTGKASLSKDRVNIKIETIHFNNKFIPVSLEVYEPNGIKGVKVHSGSNQEIKEDVTDEILDQTTASVNVPVLGSMTVGSMGKKKNDEKGVILLDRHEIIIR